MIKRLLSNPQLRSILGYLFVGALATIVEWIGFWLFFEKCSIQYLLATAFAFFFSTFANWLFGRLLVFRHVKTKSLLQEIFSIYLTSIVGLLFNLIIMFVMVQFLGITEMVSKIFATILVFAYNYIIRKLWIYKL